MDQTSTYTVAPPSDEKPITFESMMETFRSLTPVPKLPRLLAGHPCDEIMEAMGIKTSPKIEFGLALLGGITVETDPDMPPNMIRFKHADGRNDIFALGDDGVVRKLALPSLDDLIKRLRTTMEVK